MNIIDGKMISSKLKEEYKAKIANMPKKPNLVMIRIGDDEAAAIYCSSKAKTCLELGIACSELHLNSDITQEELLSQIDMLNQDDSGTGILVESPIPFHLNILEAFDRISPKKDVDGLNSINLGCLAGNHPNFVPATPSRNYEIT